MESFCVSVAKTRRASHLTPSPPHNGAKQPTSKPKKQPSVTPKRFKKFFAPSSSSLRGSHFGVSRLALGELSSSATNKKERRLSQKVTIASATAKTEDATQRSEDVSNMDVSNTAAVTDGPKSVTRSAYGQPTRQHGNTFTFTAAETDNITLVTAVPTTPNSNAMLNSEEIPAGSGSLKRKRSQDEETDEDSEDDNEIYDEDGEQLVEHNDDESYEGGTELHSEHSDDEDSLTGVCQEDGEAALMERGIYEEYNDMRDLYRTVQQEYVQMERNALNEVKPVVRSKYRGPIGAFSRRELDIPADPLKRSRLDYACNWQTQTAYFYSRPNDIHACEEVLGAQPMGTVPFCTTTFNTIALVAVGKEDGGISFLDSDKIEKAKPPGFPGTFLDFKPHNNAILAVTLSADDRRLATGSGDQTSQIIDVLTRNTTHTLRGHTSSVKHAQFQPGSFDNVIATCSRDGSVKIWDLRINPSDGPQRELQTSSSSESLSSLGRSTSPPGQLPQAVVPDMIYPDCVTTLRSAHTAPTRENARKHYGTPRQSTLDNQFAADPPSRRSLGTPSRKEPASITAMAFLDPRYPHLLITGSEANACVKIWDIRGRENNRRANAVSVSTTLEPEAHVQTRPWGMVSMVVSPDRMRVYTLTRDSTIYVYNTSQLILGKALEFRRQKPDEKYRRPAEALDGLGPMYGFRHPKLFVSSFYTQLAIRPAGHNQSELLAVGSHEKCAVVFPTDERHMRNQYLKDWKPPGKREVLAYIEEHYKRPPPEFFQRPKPGKGASDTCKIWEHGAALTRGHAGEVTGVCWSTDGELVTVSDDQTARIWREDQDIPRKLRTQTQNLADRHDWAWSEVVDDWDDDE